MIAIKHIVFSFCLLVSCSLVIGQNSISVTDLSQYGVRANDPEFDNGVIINRASKASSALFLPPGTYYFSTPIVLHNVRTIQFQGNLVYTGKNGLSAISISGQNLTVSFSGSVSALKDKVDYSSYNDDSALVGVDFVNMNNSNVYISEVKYFNENIRVSGIGAGCSYNKFILGIVRNSNVGLRVYQRDLNGKRGWANENTFIGGRFCNFADWYGRCVSYAIMIAGADNLPDSYHIANSLLFLKQSFEHYDTIVYAKNVCESDFLFSRLEGSKLFVRFVGSCRLNRVNSDYRGSCVLYDDSESKTVPIRLSDSHLFPLSYVSVIDDTRKSITSNGTYYIADGYWFSPKSNLSSGTLASTVMDDSFGDDYLPSIVCVSEDVKNYRIVLDEPDVFYLSYLEDINGDNVIDQTLFSLPKTDSRIGFKYDDKLKVFCLESKQRSVFIQIPSEINKIKFIFPKSVGSFQVFSLNRLSRVIRPTNEISGLISEMPDVGYPGQLFFDLTNKVLFYWTGEEWCQLNSVLTE